MAGEMAAAAKSASITFVKRPGQVALLKTVEELARIAGGTGGICYGLAWVWMECKANGNTATLWDDMAAAQHKPNTIKAARIFADTQRESDNNKKAAALCGLSLAVDGEGSTKEKSDLRVGDPADMKTLANWLAAANGTRYFLIETGRGGHAMAATGSRFGDLEFFDPNFGTASCFKSSNMAAFFSTYFNNPVMRSHYWSATQTYPLRVTKVKKG